MLIFRDAGLHTILLYQKYSKLEISNSNIIMTAEITLFK